MSRPLPTSNSKTRAIKDEQIADWVAHIENGIPASEPRAPRSVETGRKTIAYHKPGRSMLLSPEQWGPVGGDNEPLFMLLTLAKRFPDVNWVVAGRHGGDPGNLPSNIIVPDIPPGTNVHGTLEITSYIYRHADNALLWLGQHGTSNVPTPQLEKFDEYTFPHDSSLIYIGPIFDALNRIGPEEDGGYEPVWLCADPRNYLKARDLKWYPNVPILGQFDWTREQRHYRWGDPRTPAECSRTRSDVIQNGHWLTAHDYAYSGLELTGVPRWEDDELPDWDERERFGIVVNENRAYVNPAMARSTIIKQWVMPLQPNFVHGKWSKDGAATIGLPEVAPVHYLEVHKTAMRAKSTFTTPASGSQWATAKSWEMFALNVVCFFHPMYDTQGHIVPTLEQARTLNDANELKWVAWWLRPRTPDELRERVDALDSSRETWEWLVAAQRKLLEGARADDRCYREIARRLGL